MSNVIGTKIDAEETMARVRAILNPDGVGEITHAQKQLFETVLGWAAQFNGDRKNPIVGVVDHIGNYWRNWLFFILHTGAYRPSKIVKLLEAIDPARPISQRMLTLNLRILERDGLVERKIICDKFNHVEYRLTPMGDRLAEQILSIIGWIADNAEHVAEARANFDAMNELL